MSNAPGYTKYDDVLTSILVNEQSILGFLSAIFNFLARRTDFYYVPEGAYENMGFPPGVAEELVIKVLRTCDPKNWKGTNGARKPENLDHDIMCSTVAQEVEIEAEEDTENEEESQEDIEENEEELQVKTAGCSVSQDHNYTPKASSSTDTEGAKKSELKEPPPKDLQQTEPDPKKAETRLNLDDYEPPVIPVQKNSESYNGAVRDKYSWSQSITELDVTMKLPPDIKSAKDLKVTINPTDISVAHQEGDIIIKDSLLFKIKAIDSFWTISEGKLLIHLEKVQERWWKKLLNGEEAIDLDKIDCSRPLNELPEDHIAKVRELQWNQEQKLKGLPTSDEIRNIEILKKAWNADGSPFKGKEFDPSVLQPPH